MSTERCKCEYCGLMFEAESYTPEAKPIVCPNVANHDNKISRERLIQMVKQSMGRFFTIVFTKRTTGEKRTMTCRTGVHKHLKGGARAYDPEKLGLMIVWEPRSAEYRSIPTDAVEKIKYAGKVYEVVS